MKKNQNTMTMDKKKVVFIAIIFIAAVAAIYALASSSINFSKLPSFTTSTQSSGATTSQTNAGVQATTTIITTGSFQPSAVTLEIKSWGFNPNVVTLLKGSSATWTNKDSVTHTVTGSGFDSGDIGAGKSWSHTFSTAGTFEYSCKYHSSMTAKVIITE